MSLVAYSPGALMAAARSERSLFGLHDAALRAGIVPSVEALALAECDLRGKAATSLAWLLAGCQVVTLDSTRALALAGRRHTAKGSLGLLATEELVSSSRSPSAIVVDSHEARHLEIDASIGRLVLS